MTLPIITVLSGALCAGAGAAAVVMWARNRVTPADDDADLTQPHESCRKCGRPFDPTDKTFDGAAQYGGSGFCKGCVDRCHDNEIADHRCMICAPNTGAGA